LLDRRRRMSARKIFKLKVKLIFSLTCSWKFCWTSVWTVVNMDVKIMKGFVALFAFSDEGL
jgi:hypothetical protein